MSGKSLIRKLRSLVRSGKHWMESGMKWDHYYWNKPDPAKILDATFMFDRTSLFFWRDEKECPVDVLEPSTVPGAGKGLVANRDIKPLEPLCFYPGWYTPPLPMNRSLQYDGTHSLTCSFLFERDNGYLFYLEQHGGFLDGKDYPTKSPRFLGQLINHPPEGVLPNVWHIEFLWKQVLLTDDIYDYALPNSPTLYPWYLDPSTNESVHVPKKLVDLPGVVFVACREIKKGEEIFWDYGIKDGPYLYDWYHHVEYPKDSYYSFEENLLL